MSTTDTLI